MRSTFNDFAVGELNGNNRGSNYNSAIPYHARENSLPFSYGQITKTPTSLRRTTRNYQNDINSDLSDFDFDTDVDIDLNSNRRITPNRLNTNSSYNSEYTIKRNDRYNSFKLNGFDNKDNNRNYNIGDRKNENRYYSDSEENKLRYLLSTNDTNEAYIRNMLKTQPRLTSPLLVRKTFDASPTRSHSNTIANTYHYNSNRNYNYNNNNNNNNLNGYNKGPTSDYDFDNNTRVFNRSSSRLYNDYNSGPQQTPIRSDFEELLYGRREKIFNEYRDYNSNTLMPNTKTSAGYGSNSTIQLPSTLSNSSRQLHYKSPLSRSQSQCSKYSYDIEFNLNVDEVDNAMGRRAYTMDTSLQKQQLSPTKQTRRPLYETRDIPLATTNYAERNYHTISSSSVPMRSSALQTTATKPIYDRYLTSTNERRTATASQLEPVQKVSSITSAPSAISATSATSDLYAKHLDYTLSSTDIRTQRYEESSIEPMIDSANPSPIYAVSSKQMVNGVSRSNKLSSPTTPTMTTNLTTKSNSIFAINDHPNSGINRCETPAFPITPRIIYPNVGTNGSLNSSPVYNRVNGYNTQQSTTLPSPLSEVHSYSTETICGSNYRPRLQSSLSLVNSEPQEVAAHLVKFAKDSSKFWYKPNLSREEAISLLLNAPPGTFIVRDSTTYKNAYGLVMRVAQPPPGAATGKPDDLVRHFLIEPTTRGVRLKGCANEPVFTSLSALIYEHSINQLALPCLLLIPERDLVPPLIEPTPAQRQLITQGAACNILWLYSCDTESLTGEEAIRKAIRLMYAQNTLPTPTEVHFKVTQQGITLTDNTRKKFFRKHYTADTISYCAIDPEHRMWTLQEYANDNVTVVGVMKKTIFAFVARRSPCSKDNQCHVFCDLAINQPASAIVSFVNKNLPTERRKNHML